MKTSSSPLTSTDGELDRAAAAVEEHPRELAVLFLELEPVDGVAVGAGAGQVPASEERLLVGACGGDSRDDQRGGEGERSESAHGGHHKPGRGPWTRSDLSIEARAAREASLEVLDQHQVGSTADKRHVENGPAVG